MPILHRSTGRLRRPMAAVAAAALALPLTIASVAPAAGATVLVDRGWPPFAPYGYISPYTASALDTAEATTEQSAGLVTITSEVDFGAGVAAGTGIVIGSDGLVVTNHHVVEGATDISVTVVATGATYEAEVLGYDATKDVAVLRLDDATGLTTATADPGGVDVGDGVDGGGRRRRRRWLAHRRRRYGHRPAPADHRQRRADRRGEPAAQPDRGRRRHHPGRLRRRAARRVGRRRRHERRGLERLSDHHRLRDPDPAGAADRGRGGRGRRVGARSRSGTTRSSASRWAPPA